jgi:hypothetical protein
MQEGLTAPIVGPPIQPTDIHGDPLRRSGPGTIKYYEIILIVCNTRLRSSIPSPATPDRSSWAAQPLPVSTRIRFSPNVTIPAEVTGFSVPSTH